MDKEIVKLETAERLIVILYTGTTGVEDYKKVSQLYAKLKKEKPMNLMEVAIDRTEAVYDLDLPPENKWYLTSPDGKIGGQLTPRGTKVVFTNNLKKFYKLKNKILEHSKKLHAKEVVVIFDNTLVGGSGFAIGIEFAMLLKEELSGLMPIMNILLSTVPPLEMMKRPEGLQDALKNANTLFALKTVVATTPSIDLVLLRFPEGISGGDKRIGYILRTLGYLPIEGLTQRNQFQSEQLVAVADEMQYPIEMTSTSIIRFPKAQLKQREQLIQVIDNIKAEQVKNKASLEELSKHQTYSIADYKQQVQHIQGQIHKLNGVRSKQWRKIILEAQDKIAATVDPLARVENQDTETVAEIDTANKHMENLEKTIQKLEQLRPWLDQELAEGYHKEGLDVLRISKEEREKLGPFAIIEKMPLKTLMEKLGRSKELHDLIQNHIDQTPEAIIQQTTFIKFPKNPMLYDSTKIVCSDSINVEHISPAQGLQVVHDPAFTDEIIIEALSMAELQPADLQKTFEWVQLLQDSTDKYEVPVEKRICVDVTDDKNKTPVQYISETTLRGQGSRNTRKRWFEVDVQ
jgi:hypothetical protein